VTWRALLVASIITALIFIAAARFNASIEHLCVRGGAESFFMSREVR
jgi:hypothetical protein